VVLIQGLKKGEKLLYTGGQGKSAGCDFYRDATFDVLRGLKENDNEEIGSSLGVPQLDTLKFREKAVVPVTLSHWEEAGECR
jgi:hypothetical protein